MVKDTHQPLYTQERDPVPIVQEVGWFSVPIWTGMGKRNPLTTPGFGPHHTIRLLHHLLPLPWPLHFRAGSNISCAVAQAIRHGGSKLHPKQHSCTCCRKVYPLQIKDDHAIMVKYPEILVLVRSVVAAVASKERVVLDS